MDEIHVHIIAGIHEFSKKLEAISKTPVSQNTPTNNTHIFLALYCPHELYVILLRFNFNAILLPYIVNSFYCDCPNILL
jgi:hypothetical protein